MRNPFRSNSTQQSTPRTTSRRSLLSGNASADVRAIDRQSSKVNALTRQGKTSEAKQAAITLARMENEYDQRYL